MARTAGIAAAFLLYLIASSGIVGSLGRAHRQALKDREPRAEAASVAPDVRVEEAPALPPAPVPAEPSPPIPVARIPDPAPSPAEPVAASKLPGLEAIHPFFASAAAKRKWDLERITVEQESELGAQLHQMVMLPELNRPFQDESMERRLLDAAGPILEARERKDAELEYRFFILDSDAVNAFSHPGGYVYVTRGLMRWISEDQAPSLQFALAHEIRHVDRGHAIRCLRAPPFREMPYGTLELFYLFIFPRSYGQSFEYEADDWALEQLRALRHSRRECLTFLMKLDRYAGANGFLQGGATLERNPGVPLFDFQYRAHPMAAARLKRLKDRLVQPEKKAVPAGAAPPRTTSGRPAATAASPTAARAIAAQAAGSPIRSESAGK
ncbi:Peptidase family M48 [Planctomyces sp. SH-PL62]|nr:Peptidase family M48 [Planctomyces sp. SH-PL62]